MNGLDWLFVALGVFAVIGGWFTGFSRRILAWAGFLAGAWIGTLLLPRFLGNRTAAWDGDQGALVTAGIVVLGFGFLGQLLGSQLGVRLRRRLAIMHLGRADQALGSLLGLVGLAFGVWVLIPTMANVSGWPAEQARSSSVAAAVSDAFGGPPTAFGGLAESLGVNRLPKVFDDFERSPSAEPPPADSPVVGEVLAAAERSTFKIVGPACGLIQSGSGFVAGQDLVVTNAHVVAGTGSVEVQDTAGRRLPGTVVAFDPRNDLAAISVADIGVPALPLTSASAGDLGSVLGYPGGGNLTVNPFRVSEEITANGRDIYDKNIVERRILVLGADLAPGDSGGPLITSDGRVSGVAFAIAPDRQGTAYAIVTDDVRAIIGAAASRRPVSTSNCTG